MNIVVFNVYIVHVYNLNLHEQCCTIILVGCMHISVLPMMAVAIIVPYAAYATGYIRLLFDVLL